jgi:predicted ATPase/class 3 adenylate cyclase
MAELPTGTVTILFTDIEGSTRLLRRLGATEYARLLAEHHRVLRTTIATCSGIAVKTEGDSFFAVFHRAHDAVAAAVEAQRQLNGTIWPAEAHVAVRMGVHTGDVALSAGEYVGLDVHRAARISAAGHGGQVLLSEATRSLVEDSLPEGVTVRDLGEHMLKDLESPERICQLVIDGLPSDFPPLHAASTRFDLLPADMSSFVGREAELARARELLASTRLLTLTGPGGTGKTRLAVRLAATIGEEFADGVAFVPLASITDARLVMTTVRQVLNMAEQPGQSAHETLVERLAGREVLLVLDNFEQVADAASDVARLLEDAPGLTLVVTSRVALHVTGEQEFAVPPLGVPDSSEAGSLEQLSRAEAVALFVQRARAIRPDFDLTPANADAIVAICRRLDGLPLAIELAASRIKLLPPAALLARLERSLDLLQSSSADRTDRQRTLRGAIDWSYGLLADPERAVYRRLAVFVGGWQLDDAEPIVAAAGSTGLDLLDGLGALVDHSLVRRLDSEIQPRFTMLETIREFGREQLAATGELAPTAEAHALHFAGLVEQAEARLTAGREWPDRLEREHDNIRAMLGWLSEHDLERALVTAGRLWRFWHLRGHLREGAAVLSSLLAQPEAAKPSPARAKALIGLGGLVYWQLNYGLAQTSYEEALAIARMTDERGLEVEALYSLAYVQAIGHDWDRAIEDYRAAQELYEEQGNSLMAAWAMESIGMITTLRGEHEASLPLIEDGMRRFIDLGDSYGKRNAMAVETRALMHLGRMEEARALNRAVIEEGIAQQDMTAVSAGVHDAASLAAMAGRLESAALLTGAAQRIVEESGGQAPPELVNRIEALPVLEREFEPATLTRLLAEGRRLSIDQARELATNFE